MCFYFNWSKNKSAQELQSQRVQTPTFSGGGIPLDPLIAIRSNHLTTVVIPWKL